VTDALYCSLPSHYDGRSFHPERVVSSILIGLVFIVGGVSGKLALVGTNSGVALAVVGVLLVGRGIWRLRKQRAQAL